MRVFVVRHNKEDLAVLKELVEVGKVAPVIDRRFALSDVPDALGYQREGHPKERSSSSSRARSRAPHTEASHDRASTARVCFCGANSLRTAALALGTHCPGLLGTVV